VCGTQRARTHTATLVPSPRLRYPTCTACMVRSVLYENTCRGRCELTPPRAPPLPRAVRLRHRPLMPGTCGRSQPRTPHRWRGRGNGVRGKPSVARRGAAPPPCTHRVCEKNSGSGSHVRRLLRRWTADAGTSESLLAPGSWSDDGTSALDPRTSAGRGPQNSSVLQSVSDSGPAAPAIQLSPGRAGCMLPR
jgi:hypothetical protein